MQFFYDVMCTSTFKNCENIHYRYLRRENKFITISGNGKQFNRKICIVVKLIAGFKLPTFIMMQY